MIAKLSFISHGERSRNPSGEISPTANDSPTIPPLCMGKSEWEGDNDQDKCKGEEERIKKPGGGTPLTRSGHREEKMDSIWLYCWPLPESQSISYVVSESVQPFRTCVKRASAKMALNRVDCVFVFHPSLGLVSRSALPFQRLREGLASWAVIEAGGLKLRLEFVGAGNRWKCSISVCLQIIMTFSEFEDSRLSCYELMVR